VYLRIQPLLLLAYLAFSNITLQQLNIA
jgi:hypothetical protein